MNNINLKLKTEDGFTTVENFDEIINELVPIARKRFKKRLKTKRLKVKYCKFLIELVVEEYLQKEANGRIQTLT